MSDNVILLEVGLASVHGSKRNCTIDYRDPDFYGLLYHLAEGGYAIDKSGPLADNPSLAVISPMVGCELVGDQIDRLAIEPDNIVANALASQDDAYGHLAKLAISSSLSILAGPFDRISPAAYAEWWAARGATVGQRHGNFVLWFGGMNTEIIEPGAMTTTTG